MNKRLLVLLTLLLSSFLFTQQSIAAAPSNSIKTMATILNYLNHFPGDEEKKKLNAIVSDKKASDHEKTIASAMLNLQHSATEGDKRKLATIISDSSASEGAKDLAKIIKDLNHKPSSADKKILKKYMW
ncbi:MAG: hypothetical protein OEX07_04645 [Gammaproteobacteria bacterium]|nr:hypothetical protein [Gammaproteobacteria bacterium]